jgi:hypothetical protein
MPVRIKTKQRLQSSVTPSALGAETNIINLPDQSDDFILEGFISLRNMASGDTVILRSYVAVDGVNQDKMDELSFSGAQSIPVVRIPATTLAYNAKPRITVTQTAGTLRAFPYTIILQIMEVI